MTDTRKIKVGDGVSDFNALGNYTQSISIPPGFPSSVSTVSDALNYLYDHISSGDLGDHAAEHDFLDDH